MKTENDETACYKSFEDDAAA